MYKGIFKEEGNFVEDEAAFYYALQRIIQGTKKDKAEFIEWFYSGNWLYEKEDEQ